MYGAFIGDIVGSRFEFDRGGKTKEFELFTRDCEITDDTVMTFAVAEALLSVSQEAGEKEICNAVTKSMQKWGRRYPYAGYGSRFIHWIHDKHPQPYNSYGNGSAMRVSSVGWLYDSLERTLEVAKYTAQVSHNHPEGIKGAQACAAVIFMARHHVEKEIIKEYIIEQFGYNVSQSVDELRKHHKHVESCQDSLPKALVSFFEGESFEDVIRNAVSLGGDTDTIAAIAGSMAEAYYSVPVLMVAESKLYLEDDMLMVLENFEKRIGRISEDQTNLDAHRIKDAISLAMTDTNNMELFTNVLFEIVQCVQKDVYVSMPMIDVNNVINVMNIENKSLGDTIQNDQELRLKYDFMRDSQGKEWLPLFTDEEQIHLGQTSNFHFVMPMMQVLDSGLNIEGIEGIVVNPFGEPFVLNKYCLEIIMNTIKNFNIDIN